MKEFLKAFFVQYLSIFGIAFAQTTGTGFVISPSGYIATNYHVVSDRQSIVVRNYKGEFISANVVLTDMSNDLAVLKIESKNLSSLRLENSRLIKKGETVITIGFPNVGLQGLDPKVTEGILSSLAGIKGEPNSFQISVPLQPGNSGGPLLDSMGNVVGIVTSKLSAEAMLRSAGALPEAVNYAVKSNYLSELIRTDKNVHASVESTSQLGNEKRRRLGTAEIVERAERSIVLIIVPGTEKLSAKKPKNGDRAPQIPNGEPQGREWCPDIDNFCSPGGQKPDKTEPWNISRDWCPDINNFCDQKDGAIR